MRQRWWLVILLMPGAFSCAPPEKEESQATERHNYIILLDLSDRLIRHADQAERDKTVIRDIYRQFEEKVRRDLFIRSKDAIKVVLAHQENSPVQEISAENQLYVNMEKVPLKDRKKMEEQRRDRFFKALDDLYGKALFSRSPGAYKGADIGKYFEEDIRRDLIAGDNTINFVFVLTDGYMYIEGKQSGLSGWRTVNRNFEDLSVMLLETDPANIAGEWDRMQRAWISWFSKMGIANAVIEKRTALTKVSELMRKFIDNGHEQLGYNLIEEAPDHSYPSKVNMNPASGSEQAKKKINPAQH